MSDPEQSGEQQGGTMRLGLTQGLHRQLRHEPDRLATVSKGRRRTWRDLADRAARLAAVLLQNGMKPGDRIGMLGLNTDAYMDYMLGVWWGAGALNPINIRWSPVEVAFSLDDCDTRILLLDDHFASWSPELLERSTALQLVIHVGDGPTPDGMLGLEDLLAAAEPVPCAESGGDDLAGVFYTGGTTGFPKGVMLSHNALLFNAVSNLLDLEFDKDDVILAAAPLFHQAGMCIVIRALVRGCTVVFSETFDPANVLSLIQAERVSFTLLVPTMIQRLLDQPGLDGYDLRSLRRVLYGASPIGEGLLRLALARLPGIQLYQGYGMTETGGPYTLLPWDCHVVLEHGESPRLRSAGRPAWGYDMRIVGPDGAEVPCREIGEIVTRGQGLMQGYWGRPTETAASLRDGWMYSGDAGYVDESGYLFIVDRLKDMIVTGGENVYSAEVESALSRHPAVASCAVIGIPSERWGEAVHAIVVQRDGADVTLDGLRAHCKGLIAGYKCPVSFELRDRMPLSGAGKLLKHELRAPYWAGRDRRVN